MSEEKMLHSGIRADTGEYGVKMDIDEVYDVIRAEREGPGEAEQAFVKSQAEGRRARTLGPPSYISPMNLDEARWGIIWPPEPLTEAEQKHHEALQPLINHRRGQMGGKTPHEFHYQPTWTYDDFLWYAGPQVEVGNMRPDKVPYYLCIVASPERIPWEFQQYLDGEYAVGRLWFDEPEDCQQYVQHLLAYESSPPQSPSTSADFASPLGQAPPVEGRGRSHNALFVGPYQDWTTRKSAENLVQPLQQWVVSLQDRFNAQADLLLGSQVGGGAYRDKLLARFAKQSSDAPHSKSLSLLFTASHGLEYASDAPGLFEKQGALLLQDWPGGLVAPGHMLSGEQISASLDFSGVVAFCFACFSAGTPHTEDWVHPSQGAPQLLAPRPFVANLPQKMLAQGLLGFVGHVSRAWSYSFRGVSLASEQIVPFKDLVAQLLGGERLGHATDHLNGQWSRLTVLLDQRLDKEERYGKETIIATWLARNDFRGYVTLGDPAARIY